MVLIKAFSDEGISTTIEELILLWVSILEKLVDLIPGSPYASTIAGTVGRLAYVGYIWFMLSRQMNHHQFAENTGQEAYRKFRRWLVVVMNLDAFFFMLATVKNSNEIVRLQPLFVGGGLVFLLIGIATKVAALKALGSRGYYWYDFFLSEGPLSPPVRKGIYRYMKNPMYGVGYLHAYGFALICLSWTGVALAGFMQLTIKLFEYFVERRNFLRLYGTLLRRNHSEQV
jgi:isoprenylcysteine carboxyl methyltransferase (ICMT) family protein YpbQ